MRGVTLPARGWIACQKSVTDAGSIMVPVVRVVVPISGRPNGLKAGHGKPKRFPTEKTSRLRSFTCERTDMPGGAHQRCCAVTLATPGSLLPVLTPLLLQGRVQPAGQLVYKTRAASDDQKRRDTHRESRAREGQGEGERERRRRTHQHGPGKGRDQGVATHSGEGKRSSPPVQHEPPRSGCVAAGAMWPGVGVKPHHQLNNHWWLLVSGEHVLREGGARISKGGGQTRRRRQAGAGTPVDKVVAGEAARVHQSNDPHRKG